jgi:hypothetical protein
MNIMFDMVYRVEYIERRDISGVVVIRREAYDWVTWPM